MLDLPRRRPPPTEPSPRSLRRARDAGFHRLYVTESGETVQPAGGEGDTLTDRHRRSVADHIHRRRTHCWAAYEGDFVVEASPVRHRAQSHGEEIANSISHGMGFLAALIVLPVLVLGAGRHGAEAVVGAGVFAATVALLYLTSTLYHALAPNRAKSVFQILDHGAIYLLIAGTYTPFTLGILRGPGVGRS